MPADRLAAAMLLCVATGIVALVVAWNVRRRPTIPEASIARGGLVLHWAGFGLVFLQSAALLALVGKGLGDATLGLLVVQLGALALCASGAGMLVHLAYLLHLRSSLGLAAALWLPLLALLLVAAALYPPAGIVVDAAGPHVVYDLAPPAWVGPVAGAILAAPAAAAAWLYLSARGDLPAPARRRATLSATAFALGGLWTWWTVVLVDTPWLAASETAMSVGRVLGLLPPFVMWSAQIFGGPPLSATSPAATNA